MKLYLRYPAGYNILGIVAAAALVGFLPTPSLAQAKPKALTGKIYVASVSGESVISRGEKIEAMSIKSVYQAEGSIIQTKPNATNAIVYSNGTGVFLDQDTRIEIQKFLQDSFTPNRTDLEHEPSRSQTDALVARGTVSVCTGKLVAGSSLKYHTSLASVSTQSAKLVIEASPESTRIALLDGEGLVRAGPLDLGGKVLRAGEQAIIRPGTDHEPNLVTIEPISARDRAILEEQIFAACAARKTVYFDTAGPDGSDLTAVPVVPANLPVPVTVSPATLP